jgi:hypothetical protein
MIYHANEKGPKKVGCHDPDSARTIAIIFRPPPWTAGTVYGLRDNDNYDIVMPSVFKGFYHRVVNPGISNATTEPLWNKDIDGITEDFESGQTAGLLWCARPYNLMPMDETITLVTFSATNGVTVSGASYSGTSCQFTVDPILSEASARSLGYFQVTSRFTKSSAEIGDVTLEFKLCER